MAHPCPKGCRSLSFACVQSLLINGNKRTAVIALDIFLAINLHILVMSADQIYEMAKDTASANQQGRAMDSVLQDLTQRIANATVNPSMFEDEDVKLRLSNDHNRIMVHLNQMTEFIRALMKA